jgi:hypothetical protein
MHRFAKLLIVATAIAAAGCGSSNSGSTDPSASINRSATIAFANCMRSHGVPNFPDPSSNGRGGLLIQRGQRAGSGASLTVNGVPVNGPAFRSASQTCRKYLPNGGRPTPAQAAKMKASALAMSRCMRSHGVPNFPDPQLGSGDRLRLQINPGSGIDPNSPAFQAAQKICGPRFFGGVARSAGG